MRTGRADAALGLLAVALACTQADRQAAGRPDSTVAASDFSTRASGLRWEVRPLTVAPRRFRPGGWSDENLLWGILRDRVTSLNTSTGETRALSHNAWSVNTAAGLVSWRNERGTWLMVGDTVRRLAGPEVEAESGFDGPPTSLWSRDGSRALLWWQGEWDSRYHLVDRDRSTRKLDIRLAGYFANAAVLWLDSVRVLFQTVAMGPVGGKPEYRESGWRGDLAVLDVRSGAYARVTSVPDGAFLRVAGLHLDDVLVTEWNGSGVRLHWFYDPRTWQRRAAPLPKGRAFASPAGAAVVLAENLKDTTAAVLIVAGDTLTLGQAARDSEPVFSPSGRRGALRTSTGILLFERGDGTN